LNVNLKCFQFNAEELGSASGPPRGLVGA